MISTRIEKPSTPEEIRAVNCHRPCDQMNIPGRIKTSGACRRIAIIRNEGTRFRKLGHILVSIHGQRITSATIAIIIATTDHFCVVTDRSPSCSFCCHSDLYRSNSAELFVNRSSVVSSAQYSLHLSSHRVESWYTPVEISCPKFCETREKTLGKLFLLSSTTGRVSHQFPVPLYRTTKPSMNVPCWYDPIKIFFGKRQLKAYTSVGPKRENIPTKTTNSEIRLKKYFLGLFTFMIKNFLSPKRNRQFVFAPKIEYKLVVERSEANRNRLQIPYWCRGWDSNPHGRFYDHEILSLARIPVSPPRHLNQSYFIII